MKRVSRIASVSSATGKEADPILLSFQRKNIVNNSRRNVEDTTGTFPASLPLPYPLDFADPSAPNSQQQRS